MALPWFRVYSELLNNRKFHRLSDSLKARLLYLWCLAAKNDGILPDMEDIAFALRIPEADAQTTLDDLFAAGFLDRVERGITPHDWNEHQYISDVSTGRVKRFRQKVKRDETVSGNEMKPFLKRNETVQEQSRLRADSDTETEQSTPSAAKIAAKKSLLSPEHETELDAVAVRIHGRHPAVRRCGLGEVKTHLRAIARGVPDGERLDLLRKVDANHTGWCDTEDWSKEAGQYAKGLANWLAPGKQRFIEAPPVATSHGRPHPGLIDNYETPEERNARIDREDAERKRPPFRRYSVMDGV
jgi:hypothetical protein